MSAELAPHPLEVGAKGGKIRVGFGKTVTSCIVENRSFDSHLEFLDALGDTSLTVQVTGIDPATGKTLKDGCYIVAPMRHAKRAQVNAESAWHVCLDLDDGIASLTEARLREALVGLGYVCAFWQTTNSSIITPRWRILFCLASAVTPEEFKHIHLVLESRLRELLGLKSGDADMTAGRASQPQFLRPEGHVLHRLEAGLSLVPTVEVLNSPVATAPAMAAKTTGIKNVHQAVPADSVLAAFSARNWLGVKRAPGTWVVECPWKDEHTTPPAADGSDTVLFEPNFGGFTGYGFRCLHAHCDGRRFAPDVVNALGMGHSVGPLPDTDIANARRFVEQHGKDLRFTSAHAWFVWKESHWAPDRNGELMMRAKSVSISILDEVAAEGGATRKVLHKWAQRSQSADRLRAMVTLAQSEPGIPIELTEFDADPMLLNCRNGTVDLRTGELRPHCRDDLITKFCATEFQPEAECPLWDGFLWRALGQDEDLYNYVQRAVGYSLSGLTDEQVFFVCYGLGANGKSVFLETLGGLLGEYATTARTEMVMARSTSGIPNDIAALRGRRFVAVNETADGQRFNEPLIKDLVGGDTVSARFLYREYFTFKPEFKLWLRGNHRPVVYGTDHGIWRRIHLVPFTVAIPPAERDPDLLRKLRDERPGILRWAVEGCRLWQSNGLKPPPRVVEAVDDYRAEMDAIGEFLADRTEIDETKSVKAGDLYESYSDWTADVGEYRLSLRRFGVAIRERGFAKFRSERGVHYKGLALRRIGHW